MKGAAGAIAEALAAARTDHHPVLLDFGADWCPDCRVLDKLYAQSTVSALLAPNFHLVPIDVGQFDKNLDVAAKYVDLRTSGIPALVVLTPQGRVAYASNDGGFANARTMKPTQLAAFLRRWADAG